MYVDYKVGGEAVVLRTYYPKDRSEPFPMLLLAAEDVPAAAEEALKVLGAVGCAQLYNYVSCAAVLHGSGLVCWLMRPAFMASSHDCARLKFKGPPASLTPTVPPSTPGVDALPHAHLPGAQS